VQSGGAGAAPKKDAEDTGAKNVGLEFDAQAYGEQLQRTFAVLLDESDPHAHAFSDVTLVVHGEKVPAHRVILSAWSPVLRDYLLANADKREVELQLPHQELSVPVFKQVLRFIYTGCTELSKEIAIPLLVRTTSASRGLLLALNLRSFSLSLSLSFFVVSGV
jgi:hypothetical protein